MDKVLRMKNALLLSSVFALGAAFSGAAQGFNILGSPLHPANPNSPTSLNSPALAPLRAALADTPAAAGQEKTEDLAQTPNTHVKAPAHETAEKERLRAHILGMIADETTQQKDLQALVSRMPTLKREFAVSYYDSCKKQSPRPLDAGAVLTCMEEKSDTRKNTLALLTVCAGAGVLLTAAGRQSRHTPV